MDNKTMLVKMRDKYMQKFIAAWGPVGAIDPIEVWCQHETSVEKSGERHGEAYMNIVSQFQICFAKEIRESLEGRKDK